VYNKNTLWQGKYLHYVIHFLSKTDRTAIKGMIGIHSVEVINVKNKFSSLFVPPAAAAKGRLKWDLTCLITA
jgi:hypothetical protein